MRVINGDCSEVMASMEENSVDAVVCDPPYNIGFMGARWDSYGTDATSDFDAERKKAMDYVGNKGYVPRFGNSHGHAPKRRENVAYQHAMTPVFEEMLRVAKPGAYLLAFGSPRTFHRLACAIEDAGWIVKDTLSWNYGSGMPKGQRAERLLEQAGHVELADKWVGYNTQLKPAWEPVIMAQKPLDGTIANNIADWGVGVLNIDGCRIPVEPHDSSRDGEASADRTYQDRGTTNFANKPGPRGGDPRGRYPANLVHDGSDEVLACFPESRGQQGDLTGNEPSRPADGVCYGEFNGRHEFAKRGDSGSAARFFYCAKASKSDRNRGGVENDHISVKPNALMRWLVRLVCPEGGVVLDPFAGSGSTGVACADEGMDFIGIEMDAHYCEIAERRIASVTRQLTLF